MSRAFHPPEDEIRTITEVRREMRKKGMIGLLCGAAFGYGLHTIAKRLHSRLSDAAKLKLHFPGSNASLKFSRNTAFFSVMAGGALGSLVYASSARKDKGFNVYGGTPYQQALARSRAKEDEIHERVKRRISRRATVRKRIEEGQALSDSRGKQWMTDDYENNDEY